MFSRSHGAQKRAVPTGKDKRCELVNEVAFTYVKTQPWNENEKGLSTQSLREL